MNPFAIAALLLLCAALFLRLSKRRNAWRDAGAALPFYAKKPLASPEQVLYQRLVTALPGHIVLFRVPVSGVLGVKRGFDFDAWGKRIRHLQYDFVVCAKDATVLAAIELFDKPGNEKAHTRSDWIKAQASAAAGVQLMRWQAKALPDQAAIQALFGEIPMPTLEEIGSSANQSWWPAVSIAKPDPPFH